jgi:S-adenosylmethionine decarboxylase
MKGTHIVADFIWNTKVDKINYVVLAYRVFDIMKKAIERSGMKNVHEKLVVLDGDTPEGFTSVILLDESHITSHCYSNEGLLAIDIFTCGSCDTAKVMDFVQNELLSIFQTLKCVYRDKYKRFRCN